MLNNLGEYINRNNMSDSISSLFRNRTDNIENNKNKMYRYHSEPLFSSIEEQFYKITNMYNDNLYPLHTTENLTEEHGYKLVLSVPGFAIEDLEVTQQKSTLKVVGKINNNEDKQKMSLYTNIGIKSFVKIFIISEKFEIKEVTLDKGLLNIEIVKIFSEEEPIKVFKIK